MAEPYKNTPPAPQDKGEMTAQNIAAALAGESQASQKYLAFADVAVAEGFPNAARVFRAAAFSESMHARNHLSVLGQIGTTEENLQAAFGGESFEIAEMYPAYAAVAKLQGNESAQLTVRYALQAEKQHQAIYDTVLKGVAGKKDCGSEAVWVCPVCGYTVVGNAPSYCPECATTKEYFKEF